LSDRVTIVGASLAGVRTAKLLRRYDFDGAIALVGDEPHRPYDRPPLSKQLLAGRLEPEAIALEGDELYDSLDLHLGARAVGLDVATGAVDLDDGSRLVGDHVVVTTGAIPRRLPDQPQLAGVHVLRTLDDALRLRSELGEGRQAVIVGAGFIGMEVAATARGLGADVTVVEFLDTPLVRGLGPVLGAAIADVHRARGVTFHLGAAVRAIDGDDRVRSVELDDGTRLDADVVVVGIGVAPATGWLAGSGLTLDDGVVCDDHLRAGGGEGRVWAAGDVARWPSARYGQPLRIEHWTNATETAQVVARNLTGGDAVHDPVPYVWSDQYDLKIQVVGRVTDDERIEVAVGDLDELRFVATASRDGQLRGAVGVRWPRALLQFRMLLERGAGPDEVAQLAASLNA